MRNIEMTVDSNNILTLKIDLSKEFGLSSSGKSVIIASTDGNQAVPSQKADIKIGVNVYKAKSTGA